MKASGIVVETHPDGLIIQAFVKNPHTFGTPRESYYLVPDDRVNLTGGQNTAIVDGNAILGDNAEFDTDNSVNNSPTLDDLLETAWEE